MTGGEALQISPEVNSEIGQNRQKTTISILSKYKKLRQVYSRQVLNFSKISEVCGSLVGLPVHPCPRLLGETALLRPRGDERQLPAQGGIQQCRGRMTQQGQVGFTQGTPGFQISASLNRVPYTIESSA